MQRAALAGDGHGLLRFKVKINARIKLADIFAVFGNIDNRAGVLYASALIGPYSDFPILNRVPSQLQGFSLCEGALGFRLEELDAQDADGHQHHAPRE